MDNFVNKMLNTLPNIASNMQVSFSVSGAPAAVSVGLVGFFSTASYALYLLDKHNERKYIQAAPQNLDEELFHQETYDKVYHLD